MKVWLRGNSVVISVSGVEIDGEPVTDATVTAMLLGGNGNPVPGESWPVALNYDNGEYTATVSHEVEVDLHQKYTLVVDLERGGTVGQRRCAVWVSEQCGESGCC